MNKFEELKQKTLKIDKFSVSNPRFSEIIDIFPPNWPKLYNSPVAFINISKPPKSQPVMRQISKFYGAHYLDFKQAESSLQYTATDKLLLGPAMAGVAKVLMGRLLDRSEIRAVVLDVPPSNDQNRYALTRYAWQRGAASVVGVYVPTSGPNPSGWTEPSKIEDFTAIWKIHNAG